MKSNGFELSLSTINVKTRDFKWSTNFIYSHSKNLVTKLLSSKRVIDLVSGTGFALEGYPNHSIFSIKFKGLNDEGLPTFVDQKSEWNPETQTLTEHVSVADIYFQTSSSNPDNIRFLEWSGVADPTEVTSLGNTFEWKGFKLNVFITGSFGNVVRLDRFFRSTYNDLTSFPREFANRWTVPGDEARTTIPVISSTAQRNRYANENASLTYAYNAYNYSTERIAKGDFIRLKEISLSYDLPRKWAEAIRCNNMSLKLQATNLCLLYADSKLNGQDPEFFNTGGVAVPVPKQVTLTLKLGL